MPPVQPWPIKVIGWEIDDANSISKSESPSSLPNYIMMENQPHIATKPTYVDTIGRFRQFVHQEREHSNASAFGVSSSVGVRQNP